MKKVKFIEVKSEIGAGTRGASLGVDAIKIAALDYGSPLFRQVESVVVPMRIICCSKHMAVRMQKEFAELFPCAKKLRER
jgi:hypothetical protein